MTPREREYPQLLNGSRKKRIARGSGRTVQEINQLLKQYMQMRKMMKSLTRGLGPRKLAKFAKGLPPDLLR
jgi:signal recognition particle subunit SRP54